MNSRARLPSAAIRVNRPRDEGDADGVKGNSLLPDAGGPCRLSLKTAQPTQSTGAAVWLIGLAEPVGYPSPASCPEATCLAQPARALQSRYVAGPSAREDRAR